MAEKSVIIWRVATDGGDKWATWAAVHKSPGYGPPCCCGGFGEVQIARMVSQKPSTAKRWGKCFIIAPPHPTFSSLPLCHSIFILKPRVSRFASTFDSAAEPQSHRRDGAEERSCQIKENEPQEGEHRRPAGRRVGAVANGRGGA